MNKANSKLNKTINRAENELNRLINSMERMTISNKRKRSPTTGVTSSKRRTVGIANSSIQSRRYGESIQTGCEPIGTLVSDDNGFSVEANVRLQPGYSGSFPWLSGIALRYEQYKFDKIRVIYTPACPTTTIGAMVISFDYDAKDSIPTNISQAAQYYCKRAQPFDKVVWDISTAPIGWKTTCDLVPTGGDQKTYDAGRLICCTQGVTSGTVIGYLEIEYTIRFRGTNAVNQLGQPIVNTNSPTQIFANTGNLTISTSRSIWKTGDLTSVKNTGQTPLFELQPGTGSFSGTFLEPGTYLVNYNVSSFTGSNAGDEYNCKIQYQDGSGTVYPIASASGNVVSTSSANMNGNSVTATIIVTDSHLDRKYYFESQASANSHTVAADCLNIAITKLY